MIRITIKSKLCILYISSFLLVKSIAEESSIKFILGNQNGCSDDRYTVIQNENDCEDAAASNLLLLNIENLKTEISASKTSGEDDKRVETSAAHCFAVVDVDYADKVQTSTPDSGRFVEWDRDQHLIHTIKFIENPKDLGEGKRATFLFPICKRKQKECEDDPNFHFVRLNGEKVDCAWIGKSDVSRKHRYCSKSLLFAKSIREACPKTCGFCFGENGKELDDFTMKSITDTHMERNLNEHNASIGSSRNEEGKGTGLAENEKPMILHRYKRDEEDTKPCESKGSKGKNTSKGKGRSGILHRYKRRSKCPTTSPSISSHLPTMPPPTVACEDQLGFEFAAVNVDKMYEVLFTCDWLNKSSKPEVNLARKERYCHSGGDGKMVAASGCRASCGLCDVMTSVPTAAPATPSCKDQSDKSKTSKGNQSAKGKGKGKTEILYRYKRRKGKGKGSKCPTTSPPSSTKSPTNIPTTTPSPTTCEDRVGFEFEAISSPRMLACDWLNQSSNPEVNLARKERYCYQGGKGDTRAAEGCMESCGFCGDVATLAPTPTITVYDFAMTSCLPECGSDLNGSTEEKLKEAFAKYGFEGSFSPDDLPVRFTVEALDCDPCQTTSRNLQDAPDKQELLLLRNKIKVQVNDATGNFDSNAFIENMQNNIIEVNEDLVDEQVQIETIDNDNPSQPTISPTSVLDDDPSMPPVDLSRSTLAKLISLDETEERRKLLPLLDGDFDALINDSSNDDIYNDANVIESEDYYAGLPEFVSLDTSDSFKCKCVDCEEDEVCGGLWSGGKYESIDSSDLKKKNIHIVVSHCMSPLDWIESFVRGFNIQSIHIITKCGHEVIGAPAMASVETLPNIGRCDHTYAYFVTTILPKQIKPGEEDDSVAIFLKDDISAKNFHQAGQWNDFEGLVRLASSDNGFGCGVISNGHVAFGQHSFLLSAYHETETLMSFAMNKYGRNIKGYTVDASEFLSNYTTMGEWWEHLNVAEELPTIVPLCYGGVFAASVRNINRRKMSIWKTVEKALSRGNNIQEGHYAERSWASLLATPLQPYQIDALIDKSDGVYINTSSMHGALIRRPQLYLHIGAAGTMSSELLTNSLVDFQEELKSDGYNIAVHGRFDGGANSFPNIDRLGSCLWSDLNKSRFPEHMKEATVCNSNVLQDLDAYMNHSRKESKDMIILNPWLIRPGSAEALSIFLDPVWDVSTVIYYRRYYEWITYVYSQWRDDVLQHLLPTKIPASSFRYLDFLREYNKRLFYGKHVNEDGFPVRQMHVSNSNGDIRDRSHRIRKVYTDEFEPISNYDLEELTDLQESPYFAAKQYYSNPRLRKVEIVNFHDVRGVEVNFFCHVLDDAQNACKAAVNKQGLLGSSTNSDSTTTEKQFIQENSVPFTIDTAVEDIVMAAYTKKILKTEAVRTKEIFHRQRTLWNKMVKNALENTNTLIEDLPLECLYSFEKRRLLEVSLTYEKRMLPGFFATPRGEEDLRKSFSKWNFCSVDTNTILESPKWAFIFENAANFTLANSKAFVHIGAPKTGSTSIQDTMAADRLHLKEDKFFVAVHGQVRPPGTEDYIVDNMLVKCDQLGACLWSEEERQIVIQGSGDEDAGKCPDYLLHEFDRFASMAKEQKSNIVISNEWLNRQTSETGLSKLLQDFDTTIVIYYRRFYDWMISAHYQWHFDLGMSSFQALEGKIRLVDFIRMFCQRLFASEISNFHADTSLADLTDINEYTYHAYKRYLVEFNENIHIVNFHDGHIIKSFYCDVLKAPKACDLETKRLEEKQSTKTRSKTSTMLFDLAVGVHWSDPTKTGSETSIEDFQKTAQKFQERMLARGLKEDDLPKECLSEKEQQLLLGVSLEYERILLPGGSFEDANEKDAMKKDFAKYATSGRFCSIDLSIVKNPKWEFLFE